MCRDTRPVTSSTSACLGEATKWKNSSNGISSPVESDRRSVPGDKSTENVVYGISPILGCSRRVYALQSGIRSARVCHGARLPRSAVGLQETNGGGPLRCRPDADRCDRLTGYEQRLMRIDDHERYHPINSGSASRRSPGTLVRPTPCLSECRRMGQSVFDGSATRRNGICRRSASRPSKGLSEIAHPPARIWLGDISGAVVRALRAATLKFVTSIMPVVRTWRAAARSLKLSDRPARCAAGRDISNRTRRSVN